MALVNPNIAMSYRAPEMPNQLANYAAMQQIRGGQQAQEASQMQIDKLKRDEAALDTMMQTITSKGGPRDPMAAAEAMIQSKIPHFMDAGLKLQMAHQQTLQDRAAMGLPALGAAAPTNAMAPAAQPAAPADALGTGTFGMGMPAPTNAMAPAPVNAMAMPAEERRAREMLLSTNPGVREAGKLELSRLTAPHVVAPGGSVVVGGKSVFTAPDKPAAPTNLAKLQAELALVPAGDPRRAQYEALIRKETTHAPGTTVNVSTEKKYGERFGGLIAEADAGKLTAAEKAPQLADSANRIIDIVKQGNVFVGPAADIKLNIARALNVTGANNQEKIANTESLIAASGQSTLDAIKTAGLGTGQGFTDKDLNFLQNIAGGTVNLTPQTLTDLAKLQHLAASRSAESWNKRVQSLPKDVLQGTGLSTTPIKVAPLATGQIAARPAGVGVNWTLERDAAGNTAWVSPDRKSFKEAQ